MGVPSLQLIEHKKLYKRSFRLGLAEQPFPERPVGSACLFADYLYVRLPGILPDIFGNSGALLDQNDSFPGKEWITLVPFHLIHVLVGELLHILGVADYPVSWIAS